MLPNTFKSISDTIQTATNPIIVYMVGGQCDDHKSLEDLELERVISNSSKALTYVRACYDESRMPFPRIQENMLYYFVPKNDTPIFWRGPIPLVTFEEDVEVIYKVMEGMTYEEARYDKETQEKIEKTDAMLKEESVREFPPAFKQLRSFATDMWHSAKLGMRNLPVLANADKAFERLSICQSCDQYEPKSNRCLQCGCNMSIKTSLEATKCPLGKW